MDMNEQIKSTMETSNGSPHFFAEKAVDLIPSALRARKLTTECKYGPFSNGFMVPHALSPAPV
jgi:hypothetical protein